jgi:hypothetical protein
MVKAESLSSAIQAAEPTWSRGPPRIDIVAVELLADAVVVVVMVAMGKSKQTERRGQRGRRKS